MYIYHYIYYVEQTNYIILNITFKNEHNHNHDNLNTLDMRTCDNQRSVKLIRQ